MPGNGELAELRIDRTRRRKGAAAKLIVMLVLLLGAAGVVGALIAFRPIEVAVAAAVRDTGAGSGRLGELTAAGYVVADRQSVLATRTTGRLLKVLVCESQKVKRDELVAEVDHTEIDALIEQAKADEAALAAGVERLRKDLALAEAEHRAAQAPLAVLDGETNEIRVVLADAKRRLEMDRRLVEGLAAPSSSVDDRLTEVRAAEARLETAAARRRQIEAQAATSGARVDSVRAQIGVAEAQVGAAKARVKVLQAQLKDYQIYSPYEGIIVEKAAEEGEIVAPVSVGGQLARGSVATVADWDSLQAEVDVAEPYIGRVRVGGKASIRVDAFPDRMLAGTVRRILPRADRSKATVRVRVDFGGRDERILPEMGVRVVFLSEDSQAGEAGAPPKAVFVLPKAAVFGETGAKFVWVVSDGRARRRSVSPGEERDGKVEILDGLAEGEKVVASGADGLREDGQRVSVRRAGE